MIRQEQQTIWDGIREFAIDDPGAVVKYSDKLQQTCHWTAPYTSRVIEEYRKFIFLCMALPRGASPSHDVDEAWHMHLTYTVNYWDGLCDKVLGKPLHHHPSRGGPTEKEKHISWYRETVKGYRYYFGEDPPRDIWPPPAAKQQTSGNTPGKNDKLHYLLFVIPFLIPFFFEKSHPFDLKGPHFLVFFLTLLTCTAIFLALHYAKQKQSLRRQFEGVDTSSLNIFQFTRTIFGSNRVVQTATIDLVAKNVLTPIGKNKFRVEAYDIADTGDQNPAIPYLKRYYKEGETVNIADLEFMCSQVRILDEKFEEAINPLRKRDFISALVMILILFVAVARIFQGLSNDRPVSVLCMLAVVTGFAAYGVIQGFSGRALLQKIVSDKYGEQTISIADRISSLPSIDFAFLGISAIAGMYGADQLTNSFRQHFGSPGNGSGSGCGSSGCGSSCGGGCGGGCGGCGG